MKRYLQLHLKNLSKALGQIFRQPTATFLTVLVIAIALALPAGLRVLVNNIGELSDSWQSAADFTVYMEMNVSETRTRELAAEIERRADVQSVDVMSREQALLEFQAQSGFGEALDALDENPLPNTLVVRPLTSAIATLEALASDLDALDDTSVVQIDTEWVARLQSMLSLVRRVVDIGSVLLALAVVLVIGNTIRLEINNRRDEIEVMKLVGGSDGFIRRPFVYLGFCYGLVGALVASLLIGLALALMRPAVNAVAELYSSNYALAGLSAREIAVLLGGGAVLGWAGAWIATARHLRAIEPR